MLKSTGLSAPSVTHALSRVPRHLAQVRTLTGDRGFESPSLQRESANFRSLSRWRASNAPAVSIGRRTLDVRLFVDRQDHGVLRRLRVERHDVATKARRPSPNAINQRTCLQAGSQKHYTFDRVDKEVPEEDALEPRSSADHPQTVPTDVKPRSYSDGTPEPPRCAEGQ
jgi:hypothetical protein